MSGKVQSDGKEQGQGTGGATELEVCSWELSLKALEGAPAFMATRLPHPVPHMTRDDWSLERLSPPGLASGSVKTRGWS